MRCPGCSSSMTNAILIGRIPTQDPEEILFAGSVGQGVTGQFGTGWLGVGQTVPCPLHGGHSPINRVNQNTNVGITYSNTVQGIITMNCLRCHGGPMRTLRTYNQVRAYVDNGLLMMMVQPGGPMSRFLSAHEAHEIISWIKAGTPQ